MTDCSDQLSRRSFVRTVAAGAAAGIAQVVTARGQESLAGVPRATAQQRAAPIHLDSNENPNGPGMLAIEAIRGALAVANRYPYAEQSALRRAIARLHGVTSAEVVLGCGSSEVLRMAIHAFVSPSRGLVTAAPTYEGPSRHAADAGFPVQSVRVGPRLELDLPGMERTAQRAGLVYLCNPNNPTGAVLGASAIAGFLDRMGRESPRTAVLIDEAYHHYVDDRLYRSSIALAAARPNVIVSRTFSKLHGMAGLRCGYGVAHSETIAALERFRLENGVNQLAIAAARAAIGDTDWIERQRTLNREAREYARALFTSLGYPPAPSAANFFMVDLGRDSRAFRAACGRRGVLVGRAFPPLTTHARISVGTMDEMRRAGAVFKQVLSDRAL